MDAMTCYWGCPPSCSCKQPERADGDVLRLGEINEPLRHEREICARCGEPALCKFGISDEVLCARCGFGVLTCKACGKLAETVLSDGSSVCTSCYVNPSVFAEQSP